MEKYYEWNDNVFLAKSSKLTTEEEKVKNEFVRYTKAIKVKNCFKGKIEIRFRQYER